MGREIEYLTSICKKLTPEELKFLLRSSNDKIHSLIGEILYNCSLNENVYTNLKKNKRFKKLKSTLASNKADIYKILSVRSDGTNSEAEWSKKKRLIKKQVGNGVVGVFATLLSAVLPLIFKK